MNTFRSVVLASASPRRSQLLRAVGLDFEVLPADIDESKFVGTTPRQIACELAEAKAAIIAERRPDAVIIAADTIVVVEADSGETIILGKPGSESEAEQMLGMLQGREHSVITGYCLLCRASDRRVVESVVTQVRFKELTDQEIRRYIATGEPMDKAGAYGIQDIGAFLVQAVHGSYTNVVGLPLAEVIDALAAWGVWSPELLVKAH